MDIKENFCGACAVIPLALAGTGLAGTGLAGAGLADAYKNKRKLMIGMGIVTLIISIVIYYYYNTHTNKCM